MKKSIFRLLKLKAIHFLATELFLGVLIFALCFILCTALQLMDSIASEKEQMYSAMDAFLEISFSSSDEDIPVEEIQEYLLSNEHVKGVNQEATSRYIIAENFITDKTYTGEDPYAQEVSDHTENMTDNSVVITANLDINYSQTFRNNSCSLVKGSAPTKEAPGALISEELSASAGLEIGDLLLMKENTDGGLMQYSCTVCGIYHTEVTFSVTEDNTLGAAIFAGSPYNRIFVDMETAEQFEEMLDEEPNVTVYYDNYADFDEVKRFVENIPISEDSYMIWDTTGAQESQAISQIEALYNISRLLLLGLAAASFLLLVIYILIFRKEYGFESGMLYILGCKKAYIHLFCGIPVLLHWLIFGGVGMALARAIQVPVLNYLYNTTYHEPKGTVMPYDLGKSYILGRPAVSSNFGNIVALCLGLMAVCIGMASLKTADRKFR